MRSSVTALATVVAVLTLAGTAAAIEQPCPSGKVWDLNRGACVPKKKKVKKQSAEEKYYAALEHLSGRGKNPDPAKAGKLLDEACSKRLAQACTQLGFMHLRGRGGFTPKAGDAISYYEQACALGDPEGCVGAAEIYGAGSLGTIEHGKAIPLLDQACKADSGRACHGLAQKYDYALGVENDAARATELYTKAFQLMRKECDGGLGASCDLVGQMQQFGNGTAVDLAGAIADYEKGCKANSGDACYDFAYVTEKGIGRDPDPTAAWPLYERGCRVYDHVDACFQAGVLLALDTVKGDLSVLEPFAVKACTLSQFRCDLIGYIKGQGIGTNVDLSASVKWYDLACDQGNGTACRVMGDKYRDAFGVAQNYKKATEYFEKACDLSESWGCGSAGKLHYSGDAASGLASDQARAFTLFDIGCLRNDDESCEWAAEQLGDGTDGTGRPDTQRAATYFVTGCNLGRGQSCAFAGDYYNDGRATGGKADPLTAAGYYSQGCWATNMPSAGSCRVVGAMWHDGTGGVQVDLPSAAQALTRACALEGGQDCITADGYLRDASAGDSDKQALVDAMDATCNATPRIEASCMAWAILLEGSAYSVSKNPKAAMQLLDEVCERGEPHGCYLRGYAYETGTGPMPNADQAVIDYRRACEGGHFEGCTSLGQLLNKQGKADEALRLYKTSCDESSGTGCNLLGFAYYTAQGVAWDIAEATRLYERGCDLGDSVACSNVAEMWENGIGKTRDPAKAYELYAKACSMGFQGGCSRAAKYQETGTGGATKDLDAAEAAYDAGCTSQVPDACHDLANLLAARGTSSASRIDQLNQKAFDIAKEQSKTNPYYVWMLGTYYRDGVATVKNATKAAELFVQACEGYDPLGCIDAGRLYATGGVGLEANVELAIAQLTKACAANVDEACKEKQALLDGGDKKVPLTKTKGGCACDAGGGATGGGAWLMFAIVALLVQRKRAQVTRG